ncbi:PREDICTED: lethal(2) giant larvae protein homolog 2-like [Amphimedon queenslandica]|uniref:Lethal giant larvae homologue 2 domain-containing protein n=1 Tax=Amphimedon queenslandica TaxID=400682 RepID=A0A1X7U8H8_AMPQE|nr:PREDICTED: lethal(2) giant larvae protein homolog 2-like [Amphimedon queenslandica]|eukprot:XP_019855603.1 PREDICTED: lethal(2) giant larvae protein homolog 2-like [Amphimedon queenslandica]
MPRFKRKGSGVSRIEPLSHDHFAFRKSVFHGFPMSPSAINFDDESQLLAIGTETGELRIYGQPGVEFAGRTSSEKTITKIFSFGSLYQYLTVQDDNSLLLWQLEGESGLPALKIANEFVMERDEGKTITSACLSKLAGHFYIGTESGNVYVLDVRLFMVKDDSINWANATALIQKSTQTHPGSVTSIELSPANHNKLLIGYEKGIIVLWDVTQPLPERNFPTTMEEIKQPLTSLSWQREGKKFMSAHKDSSLYYWNINSSTPEEGPTKQYGEVCEPIDRIKWLNSTSNPLDIFSGGLPSEDKDEHNIVTVIQGTEHVALDFSSRVIDFVTITDPDTKRGKALIVLCQQELLAFDLEAPKCPMIKKPYLHSIHSSPVTCLKAFDNCPKDILSVFEAASEANANSSTNNTYISAMAWPVNGGFVRVSDPPTLDLLVTGHASGSIKFWNTTSSAMDLIYELKTSSIFQNSDGEEFDEAAFSEFQWPPYRKVSSYDPYDDDTRLSIRFIDFCPYSLKLCIGGEGGQALTFAFNPEPAEVRVEHIVADIFIEEVRTRGRGGGLRNNAPLECKSDFIQLPAGFQPSLCLQCMPAMPVTALAFRPSYGLVAVANNKGFVVANFFTKCIVLVHPTVLSDGVEARNISRVQSMRRSLRSSLRRRSSTAIAEERRKIVASFNLESGIEEKRPSSARSPLKDRRTQSVDGQIFLDSGGPVVQVAIPPEQRGVVCHLLFSETHISGGGPHVSVIASTMGSSLIRYTIEVPTKDMKYTGPNRAFPAGKDYGLVHAAPIVGLFVLDHDMQPVPSPSEIEAKAAPSPNMEPPHYLVIVTQEQIKIISLPNMRSKRKEKVNNLIHERISKAWMIKAKVAAAPIGASRDWNNALVVMTTIGHILVYSLPDIKIMYHKELYVLPSDQKAMQSLIVSSNAESFHLRSFSELERQLLCSYNFSYHTSLQPNLHSFEGATGQATQRPQSRQQKPPELSSAPGRTSSSTNSTPARETSTSKPNSMRFRSSAQSETSLNTGTSVRSRSLSPGASMELAKKKSADQPIANGIDNELEPHPPVIPEVTPVAKDVMASAAAFTQIYDSKHQGSSSSSSSDSESESESDDDDDDDDVDEMVGGGGGTFFNPLLMDDENEGGASQELDTIIASSLQQLESARSFYERMQKQARGSET